MDKFSYLGNGDVNAVDYYDGNIVLQAHSIFIYSQLKNICDAINKVLGEKVKSIYNKSSESLGKHTTLEIKNNFLFIIL